MSNAYEKGLTGQVEADRLKKFFYPTSVTKEVLGNDIYGKKVLDLGAGTNIDFNLLVNNLGGKYFAFDILRKSLLDQQAVVGSNVVEGNVPLLPFETNSVDIAHTRFVLGHLQPKEQDLTIKEAVRVASKTIFFLEWDYTSFQGGEAVDCFVVVAKEFFRQVNFDSRLGSDLESIVKRSLKDENAIIESETFLRKPGDYYGEVIDIGRSFSDSATRLKLMSLKGEIDQVTARLITESQKDDPEKFSPAAINAVKVVKY